MKTKIYVVSGRFDTEIIDPSVFKTRKDAGIYVSDFIYKTASMSYEDEEGLNEELDRDILDEWAENNGYEFHNDEYGGVFYDGGEYTELVITEHKIEI